MAPNWDDTERYETSGSSILCGLAATAAALGLVTMAVGGIWYLKHSDQPVAKDPLPAGMGEAGNHNSAEFVQLFLIVGAISLLVGILLYAAHRLFGRRQPA